MKKSYAIPPIPHNRTRFLAGFYSRERGAHSTREEYDPLGVISQALLSSLVVPTEFQFGVLPRAIYLAHYDLMSSLS